jgi:hypothetical protein
MADTLGWRPYLRSRRMDPEFSPSNLIFFRIRDGRNGTPGPHPTDEQTGSGKS